MVDDSKMLRQAMKELLKSKTMRLSWQSQELLQFNVFLLNRPDLILLDYNMPICNGKQVLEMIRSEEDFADIPVFFPNRKGR